MRRALGAMLIAGLLFGTAACGSSGGDDSSKSDSTESSSSDSGSKDEGSSSDSGNADVQAYCDAVDDYVEKVQAAQGDAAKAAELAGEAEELSKKAAALGTADLSADEVQEVADCTKKSTEALMPS